MLPGSRVGPTGQRPASSTSRAASNASFTLTTADRYSTTQPGSRCRPAGSPSPRYSSTASRATTKALTTAPTADKRRSPDYSTTSPGSGCELAGGLSQPAIPFHRLTSHHQGLTPLTHLRQMIAGGWFDAIDCLRSGESGGMREASANTGANAPPHEPPQRPVPISHRRQNNCQIAQRRSLGQACKPTGNSASPRYSSTASRATKGLTRSPTADRTRIAGLFSSPAGQACKAAGKPQPAPAQTLAPPLRATTGPLRSPTADKPNMNYSAASPGLRGTHVKACGKPQHQAQLHRASRATTRPHHAHPRRQTLANYSTIRPGWACITAVANHGTILPSP